VTLKKIAKILEAIIVLNLDNLEDINIQWACSADLMSDVLFYYAPHSILITGLTQPQVVTTAEIAGIKSIVFVQNKKPPKETVELAEQKRIALLTTPYCMYTASGKLFQEGLPGCPKK
jgi:predicted transcriptional regulator